MDLRGLGYFLRTFLPDLPFLRLEINPLNNPISGLGRGKMLLILHFLVGFVGVVYCCFLHHKVIKAPTQKLILLRTNLQ